MASTLLRSGPSGTPLSSPQRFHHAATSKSPSHSALSGPLSATVQPDSSATWMKYLEQHLQYRNLLNFLGHMTQNVANRTSAGRELDWSEITKEIKDLFRIKSTYIVSFIFAEDGVRMKHLYDCLLVGHKSETEALRVHRDYINSTEAKRLSLVMVTKFVQWKHIEDTEGNRADFERCAKKFRELERKQIKRDDLIPVVEELNQILVKFYKEKKHDKFRDTATAYVPFFKKAYHKYGFEFPPEVMVESEKPIQSHNISQSSILDQWPAEDMTSSMISEDDGTINEQDMSSTAAQDGSTHQNADMTAPKTAATFKPDLVPNASVDNSTVSTFHEPDITMDDLDQVADRASMAVTVSPPPLPAMQPPAPHRNISSPRVTLSPSPSTARPGQQSASTSPARFIAPVEQIQSTPPAPSSSLLRQSLTPSPTKEKEPTPFKIVVAADNQRKSQSPNKAAAVAEGVRSSPQSVHPSLKPPEAAASEQSKPALLKIVSPVAATAAPPLATAPAAEVATTSTTTAEQTSGRTTRNRKPTVTAATVVDPRPPSKRARGKSQAPTIVVAVGEEAKWPAAVDQESVASSSVMAAPEKVVQEPPSKKKRGGTEEKTPLRSAVDNDVAIQNFENFVKQSNMVDSESVATFLKAMVYYLFSDTPSDCADYDPFKLPISPDIAAGYGKYVLVPQSITTLVDEIRSKDTTMTKDLLLEALRLIPANALAFNNFGTEIFRGSVDLLALILTTARIVPEIISNPGEMDRLKTELQSQPAKPKHTPKPDLVANDDEPFLLLAEPKLKRSGRKGSLASNATTSGVKAFNPPAAAASTSKGTSKLVAPTTVPSQRTARAASKRK